MDGRTDGWMGGGGGRKSIYSWRSFFWSRNELKQNCVEPGSLSSGCSRGGDLLRLSLQPGSWGLRGAGGSSGSRKLTSKSTFSPSGILGAVSLKKRERLMSGDEWGPHQDSWPGPTRPGPPAFQPGTWPRTHCLTFALITHITHCPQNGLTLRGGFKHPSVLPTSGPRKSCLAPLCPGRVA